MMPRIPTLAEKRLEAKLLDECLENQGEYLDAHHPPTSFSTRYSTAFVKATQGLFKLYAGQGHVDMAAKLSHVFQDSGVRSCRGEAMTEARVKYLLEAYTIR